MLTFNTLNPFKKFYKKKNNRVYCHFLEYDEHTDYTIVSTHYYEHPNWQDVERTDVIIKHHPNAWKRDLTRECVESNPGPDTNYRLYTHVAECEELLQLQYVMDSKLKLQTISELYKTSGEYVDTHLPFFQKILEDMLMFINDLVRAKDTNAYYSALAHFIKHRTNSTLYSLLTQINIKNIFDDVFKIELQSGDNFFKPLRNFMSKYEEVKESKIFKKLYKFLMYILSLSLFEKIGITFDTLNYSKIEAEAIKKQYHLGVDFFYSMLDTLVFLCERGYQCMVTGTLDPLFHSGGAYEDWYNKALEIKRKSLYLSNPEAQGFSRFSYIADLNDHIEKGRAIYKHVSVVGGFEKKMVQSILNDLELIKCNDCTKRAAQQERKAPFSVLLYGGSSVAKSTLTKLLFYHYGKLFDLPVDDEFKYTRNPIDDYWVNFNSSQWCVQLDDIAFMHPNKASNGDPTLLEMLQVVNNVPFVPIQADLADKGKTPLISRFVIATTNTEDLNAYAYFACPLAVQRRLPFVIDVQPKDEYTKDMCMFDGSKVPELKDGEYPDYWNFIVKKVVPQKKNRTHQRAKLEVVDKFYNIIDFIQWFSVAARDFEEIQDKAMRCDNIMSNVTLCSGCYVPQTQCRCLRTQTDDHIPDLFCENSYQNNQRLCDLNMTQSTLTEDIREKIGFMEYYKDKMLLCMLYCYFNFWLFRVVLNATFGSSFLFRESYYSVMQPKKVCALFKVMGNRVHRKIGFNPMLVYLTTTISSIYIFYNIYKRIYKLEEDTLSADSMNKQSEVDGGKRPEPDENTERVNVWYKDDYVTTNFDISPQISSSKGLDKTVYTDIIFKNCVFFRSHHGDGISRPTRGLCVGGHVYICNNHGLPEADEFQLSVVQQNNISGIDTNITFQVDQSLITRFPERDIAFIVLRNLPPRKNIVNMFAKPTFRGKSVGYYISRDESGKKNKLDVENIVFNSLTHEDLDISTAWTGAVALPTKSGFCGSALIADSPVGPMIVGLHTLGHDDVVAAVNIDSEFILDYMNQDKTLHVQSGEPSLQTDKYPMVLSDLHRKSPCRYIEEGTAAVYGSFVGFRAKPKSRVGNTYIQPSMLKRGYTICHDAPVMCGWEPWRIALLDMTRPVCNLNNKILGECVKSFGDDILSRLSKESLSQVFVYDDCTAINGAAGVLYVDKMNRSTSAGNPFKCSKKYFLTQIAPIGDLQDPVEVSPEIMERVREFEEKYKQGERCFPNFCAHLKDEATSFKKIETKKTRVFTGAPFDWSIVVRKYMLSLIKLIQSNRFIFESAPGTIAQSLEWNEIKDYLCHFGEDKLIAGDYGKFDKRMPSTVILAAFDILKRICKAAGYSETELTVVQGIAEDTAFPLVDFNGDLIEFYGSNPSGHPLTVIINGLANALYMRYCYAVLHPNKSAVDFKKKVNLITYGDDNAMGVDDTVPWFNHTSIQKVLADIDIVYTMADKEAASIPYINIKDVSFLKRTWRFEKELGTFVCPLDHDSINKMLTKCVKSKTISEQHQSMAIIETALREYFWYGKEVFDNKRLMFADVIEECDLQHYVSKSTLPVWEELIADFKQHSRYFSRSWSA